MGCNGSAPKFPQALQPWGQGLCLSFPLLWCLVGTRICEYMEQHFLGGVVSFGGLKRKGGNHKTQLRPKQGPARTTCSMAKF